MKTKAILTMLAALAAGASTLLVATAASAYTSQADCESYEGAGKCSYCPIATGDPGWHTSSACGNAVMVSGGARQVGASAKVIPGSSDKAVASKAISGAKVIPTPGAGTSR